jgi:N-acetylglucosaminyldiphosphoundecaprenol N-acetyl-beta-D-mannosaminyltransferase
MKSINAARHEMIPPQSRYILSMRVDVTSYIDATERIVAWANQRRNGYVCAANVHMTMEAFDSQVFAQVVNNAILVTPDGMPLVWALKALGIQTASRVYGPTLVLHICEEAARQGIPIGLYGGTPDSLAAFAGFLYQQFPNIEIACQISPPFRPLTSEEDRIYTRQIVESGTRILFVGIGCPKQEYWMAAHRDTISAVMIGVGAAFDFHSGRVKQAPQWMQKRGLEWLFRLRQEPKRLWKRYVLHNPRFVVLFLLQWISRGAIF